jgi:hypothetical protein
MPYFQKMNTSHLNGLDDFIFCFSRSATLFIHFTFSNKDHGISRAVTSTRIEAGVNSPLRDGKIMLCIATRE